MDAVCRAFPVRAGGCVRWGQLYSVLESIVLSKRELPDRARHGNGMHFPDVGGIERVQHLRRLKHGEMSKRDAKEASEHCGPAFYLRMRRVCCGQVLRAGKQ